MHAAHAQVRAVLDPDTISEGEMTELRITIDGLVSTGQPTLPNIDGLEVVSVNSSTTMQFINGHMSGAVTYVYGILAHKAGDFTIPSIQIEGGKNGRKTNPLQLHVSKSADVYVQPQTPTPTPTPPTSSQGSSSAAPAQPDHSDPQNTNPKQVAWIELNYPKRDFYVGELIPVELKVYIPKTLQFVDNTLPAFTGSSFTYSKLGQEEHRDTTLNGMPYSVYTWHPTISAVKVGDHPLNAQMDLIVLVPKQTRQRFPFGGGAFNDPFFDSFFNDVEKKKITLSSPIENVVKVLPLPAEGKPTDFSGAIGKFQMSATADPVDVNAGDPITVKIKISGTGNFDRVHTPDFPKSDLYKTYPPNSKFEASDEVGFTGEKQFEQVIIPKSSELKQIPEVQFHYFDPEGHRYVSLTSNPIKIKVSGTSAPESTSSARIPVPTVNPGTASKVGVTELVANKLDIGTGQRTLTPIICSGWFWGLTSLPILGLAIAWFIATRRQKLASDPEYARSISASKAIRTHLQSMDQALRKGDSNGFFVAGRRALRERLGECLGKNPETITLSEVEQSFELNPQLNDALRRFFEMADAVEYSGETYTPQALAEWKQAVLAILQQLEKRKKS